MYTSSMTGLTFAACSFTRPSTHFLTQFRPVFHPFSPSLPPTFAPYPTDSRPFPTHSSPVSYPSSSPLPPTFALFPTYLCSLSHALSPPPPPPRLLSPPIPATWFQRQRGALALYLAYLRLIPIYTHRQLFDGIYICMFSNRAEMRTKIAVDGTVLFWGKPSTPE